MKYFNRLYCAIKYLTNNSLEYFYAYQDVPVLNASTLRELDTCPVVALVLLVACGPVAARFFLGDAAYIAQKRFQKKLRFSAEIDGHLRSETAHHLCEVFCVSFVRMIARHLISVLEPVQERSGVV